MHGGKREGAGRKAGSPNKITTELKETILEALESAHPDGAIGYLQEQANKNATAFMTLIGKILPLQVTGKDGGSIVIEQKLPEQDRAVLDHYIKTRGKND